MPNPELTSKEFWSQITGWQLLRGNALAYVEPDARGRPAALWPVPWTRVTPARAPSGALVMIVNLASSDRAGNLEPNRQVSLLPGEYLHWRDFGVGPVGMSRISYMAETAGLALAGEEFGARFFANDASPGGFITTPKRLSESEWAEMRGRWEELHRGVKHAHMMGILENADWKQAGISARDAQLLELRGFQVEEVARWFRVPLHLLDIAKPGAVSYASVEQFGLEFVKYSLMPKLTRLEDVASYGLLDPRGEVFMRFEVDGLLRGDTAARYAAYAIGRQWGFLSVNDIRRLEDEEPIGLAGDVYLEPINMAPAGTQALAASGDRDALALLERLGTVGYGPAAVTRPAASVAVGNGHGDLVS